jgi:hypothetical protein
MRQRAGSPHGAKHFEDIPEDDEMSVKAILRLLDNGGLKVVSE